MITLLRIFYRAIIWASIFELALARQSNNPKVKSERSERLRYWELEAQRFEWSLNS